MPSVNRQHAAGCRNSACQGCLRAGEGHGIDSPAHALAVEKARLALVQSLSNQNVALRATVERQRIRIAELELRLRGVPAR